MFASDFYNFGNKRRNNMETKKKNLYRVRSEKLNSPHYAAADDQLEAAKKVAYEYDDILPATCSVEYVGEVKI